MLVLTRREGQSIYIGDDIVLTVVRINKNGDVRFGIEAPKSVAVHREEVYARIKREEANEGSR